MRLRIMDEVRDVRTGVVGVVNHISGRKVTFRGKDGRLRRTDISKLERTPDRRTKPPPIDIPADIRPRLEALAKANGLTIEQAYDAVRD